LLLHAWLNPQHFKLTIGAKIMNLYEVTLTNTVGTHTDIVQGKRPAVEAYAEKEAKAYGATVSDIHPAVMPDTKAERERVIIL
jgi:hypothetical protein